MNHSLNARPIAALVTPRDEQGNVHFRTLERNAHHALAHGATGLCVGAAEGEYVAMSSDERIELFRRARHVAGPATLICGIGAPNTARAIRVGAEAFEMGADFALLPPPSYYRYEPCDIEAFYGEVARKIEGPTILSNNPRHCTPVEPALAAGLCLDIDNLVGVRDRGDSLDILRRLTFREGALHRLTGRSSMLAAGLEAQCCDGVVSGLASVLPELVVATLDAHAAGFTDEFKVLAASLEEVTDQISKLPIPWGLKLIAECRGLGKATFSVPLSSTRREAAAAFNVWFRGWWNGPKGAELFERKASAAV